MQNVAKNLIIILLYPLANFKIPDNEMGLDIGDESINIFSEVIQKSTLILWNGPMGVLK